MNDTIGNVVVVLFIIGSIYGIFKQIHHTLTIQKEYKSNKRLLVGTYITSVSLAGFVVSFL